MNVLLESVIIILSLNVLYNQMKFMKRKKRKSNNVKLIVSPKIAEEEVTPTLIESITASNLELKRQLIVAIGENNIDDWSLLQERIISNNQFILEMFEYDEKIRKYMNGDKKESIDKDIDEDEVMKLIDESFGKQRLGAKVAKNR